LLPVLPKTASHGRCPPLLPPLLIDFSRLLWQAIAVN